LPGSKNLKRLNLAISSFKKGQIFFKKFDKITKLKFTTIFTTLKNGTIWPFKRPHGNPDLIYSLFMTLSMELLKNYFHSTLFNGTGGPS